MTAKKKSQYWEIFRGAITAIVVLFCTIQIQAAQKFMRVPQENTMRIDEMRHEKTLDSLNVRAEINDVKKTVEELKKDRERLKKIEEAVIRIEERLKK